MIRPAGRLQGAWSGPGGSTGGALASRPGSVSKGVSSSGGQTATER
jgi:hypothetical protein